MDLQSGCENSSSPCSELLERLKNLRRWQEEQRRELMCQSPSVLPVSPMSRVDTKAGCESLPVGLSQSFMSSTNTQSTCGKVSEETPQSVNASSSSSSGVNYSVSSDGVPSSPNFSEDYGLQNQLVLPRASLSLEELPQSQMSENVFKNSDIGTAREGSASDDEIGRQNINHELLYKRDSCSADFSLGHEDDPIRKLQGLSRFVARHSPGGVPTAVDAVRESEVNASIGGAATSSASSSSKPKFTFLRKGEGTSRFGMKHVKLKPKIYKDSADGGSEAFTKLKPSPIKKPVETKKNPNIPKGNTTAISRMAVKKLQLQKDPAKTSSVLLNLEESNRGRYSVKSNHINNFEQPHFSQQNKLKITDDKQSHKEREELSAFERLEELAEDSSFSSNASTVVQLLQRGLHSSSSTPVRSSPPPMSHFMPLYHTGTDRGASVKLMDRIEEAAAAATAGQAVPQQTQLLPSLSISQVLEQLQGIIRLEDINEGSLSQEELKLLIESFYDPETSLPVRSASDFENNIKLALGYPTSTPAVVSEEVFPPRPRVHFRPEGVEVLEYEVSESDEENTLTDTPSIAEDTDLVTTSDLEMLTKVNIDTASDCKGIECKDALDLACEVEGITPCQESVPQKASHMSDVDSLKPLKLQFSPPRRPENSASHYIWSIFKKQARPEIKDLPRKRLIEDSKKSARMTTKSSEHVQDQFVLEEKVERNAPSKTESRQEVETHKTLLLAKVCELEKEMELYKKENSKLKSLREMMLSEQCQLDQEKQKFAEEMVKEKKRFQDYMDRERNALWKEKQAVAQQSPSFNAVKEQSLEIVYLKEKLHDLQEELKKKESLHQFALKKLNEKNQVQEEEIKLLKEKNNHLQRIEKENIHLKHEVDRTKLNRKPVPTMKPGRQRLKTKTATISSTYKSLDNVHSSVSPKDTSSRPLKKKTTIHSINKSLDKIVVGNAASAKEPLSNSWPEVQQTHSSEDIGNLNEQEHHILNSPAQRIDSSERLIRMNNMKNILNIRGRSNLKDDFVDLTESQENYHEGKDEQPHTDFENPARNQESPREAKDSPTFQKNLSIDCTELCHSDGTKEIIYANGNKKEILPNGSVIISYYNGDRKEVYEDRTVYVYGTDLTSHTTFLDGREVLEFPNGQKETRFSDGSSEIVFSDNTRKAVLSDGTELCTTKDGTVVHTNPDGIKVFEFVSGQREVHTPEQKRREYPDGTVKILHSDGRTETRYKKGRVRIKDKEGNVITDTHQSVQ